MAAALIVLAAGCGGGERAAKSLPNPSPGCHPGAIDTSVRAEERTLDVAGVPRTYILDVPVGPADRPRPLLLAFHAFDARGRRLRRGSLLGRLAHRRGVIVAFPDGSDDVVVGGRAGRGWHVDLEGSPDVTFVRLLLDQLERDWCVDRNRVWVTGMSNGAAFASMLPCVLPGRIAGIAPVAGARTFEGCTPARPIPVLIIHGRADRVVPIETARAARDWWVKYDGCGEPREDARCEYWERCGAVKMTYCEGLQGHTWPRPAGRRIMDFLGAPIPTGIDDPPPPG
jgi:polyhydroxybutyrate depolymerase